MISESITQEVSDHKIMYAPAREISTDDINLIQEIPIDGPHKLKPGYDLIPPMQTDAVTTKDQKHITVKAIVYINSSHKITSLSIYEKPEKDEKKHFIIEFDKKITAPTTDFITYLVEFKIDYTEELKDIYLYLKSSNPRTSRGTVTTVRRPM